MSRAIGRMEVLPDPLALARHVAEWMTATAVGATGPFRVALSGGSTPKTLYGRLASDEFRGRFPWPRVSWYWGDERFVPHDHPDSNYRMAREAMLAKAPIPRRTFIPFRPTELLTRLLGATNGRCRAPTVRQSSIRLARSST